MDLLLMMWEFFKTGLFAVGGGMATIPFLTRMANNYPRWFTISELADMIAVSESTPGPIGVNMSTFAGYNAFGLLGAVLVSLSLVLPSFICILLIAGAYDRYRQNKFVNAGFMGIRPAVTGMIAAAGFTVFKLAVYINGKLNLIALTLFVVLFALTRVKRLKNLHPIAYIAVAAVIGIVIKL